MQIKNKTVVVTGANRGMGKAFCRRIASENTALVLVNRKANAELENELKDLGAKSVVTYEADLADPVAVENVGKKINDHDVDILFNNAGLLTGGLLETQKMSDIHRMLTVNINTVIQLSHAVLPQMLNKKSGKIVNHSSVASLMNLPAASTYSASKAAVLSFTEALRKELKGTGVSTLVLLTPGVKTDMFDEISNLYGDHLKIKLPSTTTSKYVELIYEAIRMDLDVLKPSGFTGANLKLSHYLPKAFDFFVDRAFKR